MLSAGYYLQQYKILDVLGVGGFSVTYLAIDEKLDRKYAIKEYCPEEFAFREGATVRPREQKSDDFNWGLDRFVQEARVLAKFNHPNIVGVNQIIEANNTAYIVLEYQSGRSLKDFFAEIDGAPTQQELDDLLNPILNALGAIHRNNLLHRDIAPDNIYIRDDGSPVLLDFGSARDSLTSRSKTISAIVKSGYSPPEQYSSKGSGQGPWTDIYALSATIYQAVSGKAPEEATERLLNDELLPIRQATRGGEYRTTFLDAVDWALKIQPKERPQTVDQWREALMGEGRVSQPEPATGFAAGDPEKNDVVVSKPRKGFSKGLILVSALGLAFFMLAPYLNQNKAPSIVEQKTQSDPIQKPNNSAQSAPLVPSLGQPKQVETVKVQSGNKSGDANSYQNAQKSEVCRNALSLYRNSWDDRVEYISWVNEAKSRNLTVEDCQVMLGIVSKRIIQKAQESCDLLAASPKDSNKPNNVSGVTIKDIDYRSAIPACQTAVDNFPSSSRLKLQLARALEASGSVENYKLAVEWYIKAAEEGNATAQYNLALEYEAGRGGLQKSEVDAARYYKLAADQGYESAQFKLGLYYENGRGGLNKDISEALRYYRLAFEQGNSDAKDRLSYLESPYASFNKEPVCRNALSSGAMNSWETRPQYIAYVDEAKSRGFTVESCRQILGLSSQSEAITTAPSLAVQKSNDFKRSYISLKSVDICRAALSLDKSKWDDQPNSSQFSDEAKARGLTVSDCQKIITYNNTITNLSPNTRSQSDLGNASVENLCRVALSSDKNSNSGWDESGLFIPQIQEALSRGLTIEKCQRLLNIIR